MHPGFCHHRVPGATVTPIFCSVEDGDSLLLSECRAPQTSSHGVTVEREGRERLKTPLGPVHHREPVTPFLLSARVTHGMGWHVEVWNWASAGSQSPQAGSALSTWLDLAEASLLCCCVFLVVPAVFPVNGSHTCFRESTRKALQDGLL